ncbi:metal/formaldehyde-sensitive transcriptional repressor [Rhizobium leguminosarum]|uniref:metal/formaldehyde-sensitive transcriptional repressor n=1 Tax=Rhizobium leguminosarum TaxID=384 RepID=UPI001C9583B0|nr:metal/formaldehyde-sensitive transcriptional repressor [Rhizobium leguminosarum]MBY5605739.1 metal/formaldehyde-sensitive transcriptional repressor [Rhizobium leguminosarum]
MPHTTREKTKLINRVRRIRGQIEAVERMLEDEKSCAEVLQVIAGARGAINGPMSEMIEDHILLHVAAGDLAQNDRDDGAAELVDVVRAYLK